MKEDFIRENVKKKPVNKSKLIKKMLINVLCAVIFGIIASLVMLLMYPYLQKKLNKNQSTEHVGIVTLPENNTEKSPEEMLSEYMLQESALLDEYESEETLPVEMPLSDEQIEAILSRVVLDVTSYRQLSTSMAALARELSKYMVTVTSISTSVDWLSFVNNSNNVISGIVFARNNVDLFILADSAGIKQNDELKIGFYNSVSVNGVIKAIDTNTGLAVISVSLADLPPGMNADDYIAKIGSSNGLYVGLPVMAVGSPIGISGSMGYGILNVPKQTISQIDSYVTVLQSNISGSNISSGALFNLQGQVIGIITNDIDSTSGQVVVMAYGISELKSRIEKMSNGESINYLGISFIDVTSDASTEYGVPIGVYIKSVQMDSPAMKAGMQIGDVIVDVDGNSISTCNDYMTALNQKNTGDTIVLKIMRKSQDTYISMEFELEIGAF